VQAHKSDCGLDLLAVADEKYLRGVKYKTFHVRHITELLRTYIINEFAKESYGWGAEYIDFFYDYTLPYNFAHAVMLVAECFTEYRQKGKYALYDYKAKEDQWITEFIFTDADLEFLRTELQSILNPEHGLHESWKDSEIFDEWQSHIQMLCDTLSQAIDKGGDSHA
jgi:hypothetical protein